MQGYLAHRDPCRDNERPVSVRASSIKPYPESNERGGCDAIDPIPSRCSGSGSLGGGAHNLSTLDSGLSGSARVYFHAAERKQGKIESQERQTKAWTSTSSSSSSSCCSSSLPMPPKSTSCNPLSSEFGTNKTVKARFWPCLEPCSVRTSLKPSKVFPLRSEATHHARTNQRIWHT